MICPNNSTGGAGNHSPDSDHNLDNEKEHGGHHPAFRTEGECTKECKHKYYSHSLSTSLNLNENGLKIPRPKSSINGGGGANNSMVSNGGGNEQLSYLSQLTAESAAEQLNTSSLTPATTTNSSPSNSQGKHLGGHRGSSDRFGDFCISLVGNHILACTSSLKGWQYFYKYP